MVAEAAAAGWGTRGAGCLSQSSVLPARRLPPAAPLPWMLAWGTLGHRVTGQALREGWGGIVVWGDSGLSYG